MWLSSSAVRRTLRLLQPLPLWIALAPPCSPLLAAVRVAGVDRPVPVVIAAGASEQERTAAAELADYLGKVTGRRPPLVSEDQEPAGPAIHVGATAEVRRRGGRPEKLGDEEWVIDSRAGDVLLYGGHPRGTLYAVYRFLEDRVGVDWWSPFEERVPRRPVVEVRRGRWQGRPRFPYRDIRWIDGPRPFNARSRINGHFTQLPWAFGGAIDYGPPRQVHNLHVYVPPEDYYREHPEYYAEIDGEREPVHAQLCLTDPGLRRLVERRLREFIEQGRLEAARRGRPAPTLYAISQEDFGRPCQCDRCSEVARHQRSESGPLIDFLNAIADGIRVDHPEILIDTLAYLHTLQPPRLLRPRDNIAVRVSGLQYRDYARSILHPNNTVYREALLGWSRITKHLRVWDYTVTFGEDGDLPLPNLAYLAEDFRFYAAAGVEGLFIQHEHPIAADLRDLKLWVIARLLEDPTRSEERLVRHFTEGFYGPAAGDVRRYLRSLERAARRHPCRIRFVARGPDYCYLDLPFLRRASRIFDRAEGAVEGDALLLRRVRHARLSLDRALLVRWPWLRRRWEAEHGPQRAFPFDFEAVARRYRDTWAAQVSLRAGDPAGAESRRILEQVEREIDRLRERRDAGSGAVDMGTGAS